PIVLLVTGVAFWRGWVTYHSGTESRYTFDRRGGEFRVEDARGRVPRRASYPLATVRAAEVGFEEWSLGKTSDRSYWVMVHLTTEDQPIDLPEDDKGRVEDMVASINKYLEHDRPSEGEPAG